MSLAPLFFSDWWENLKGHHHLLDQNFGRSISPEIFFQTDGCESSLTPSFKGLVKHPAMYLESKWGPKLEISKERGTSVVKADREKFEVVLDVEQFKPEEIKVKVVGNCVIIEGQHDEKEDEYGWISRQFVRKYFIPLQCDVDKLTSSLSSDGILTITAPRKDKLTDNERTVKIEQTGKPAVRENEEKLQKKKEEEPQKEEEEKK